MAVNPYQKMMISKIESALAQARGSKGITHQGLKGEILEIIITELFEPLLPADIGIGSGQIIEYKNKTVSSQFDIILYDKSILPPILFKKKSGIFPIESVLYTIEIKTTLNVNELKNAHLAAKALRSFSYLPGLHNSKPNSIEPVRSVLFALKSDLSVTGKSEVERYREIYYPNDHPYIRAICVVDRGYWFEKDGGWIANPTHVPYSEILSFIGGVCNTYKSVAASRGSPSLGYYVIDYSEVKMQTEASSTKIQAEV